VPGWSTSPASARRGPTTAPAARCCPAVPEGGFRQGCALHLQRPDQQPEQSGFRGLAGRCRVRGRRKYVPVGLAAASMRLTPRTPTPPHLRQIPAVVGVDLGRHGRSTNEMRGQSEIFDFDGIIHAWRGSPTDRRKLSKAGWVRLRERERHGWRGSLRGRVYGVPRNRTHPAIPRNAAVAVAVALPLPAAGAGRSPAEHPNRQAAPGTGTLCRHQIANVT
jgi:hypothetical protein